MKMEQRKKFVFYQKAVKSPKKCKSYCRYRHACQVHRVPFLLGSLTSCVRKLSSTHSRIHLDCFLSAVLYLQQTFGKVKSSMRTRATD